MDLDTSSLDQANFILGKSINSPLQKINTVPETSNWWKWKYCRPCNTRKNLFFCPMISTGILFQPSRAQYCIEVNFILYFRSFYFFSIQGKKYYWNVVIMLMIQRHLWIIYDIILLLLSPTKPALNCWLMFSFYLFLLFC